jgi:hypothetical protein
MILLLIFVLAQFLFQISRFRIRPTRLFHFAEPLRREECGLAVLEIAD